MKAKKQKRRTTLAQPKRIYSQTVEVPVEPVSEPKQLPLPDDAIVIPRDNGVYMLLVKIDKENGNSSISRIDSQQPIVMAIASKALLELRDRLVYETGAASKREIKAQ